MKKKLTLIKHDFFIGEWKIKRSINDTKNSKFFSFFGKATLKKDTSFFLEENNFYIWKEKGSLLVGEKYLIAKNKYIWKKSKNFWEVFFFDNINFFYKLDISKEKNDFFHKCKQDTYLGKKIIRNERFLLEWKIIGPNKNIIINSIYYR